MNEFQGVSLVIEYTNTSIQLVLAYTSILSAFLVMTYLAADKLNTVLSSWVLILFTLVCVLLIFQIYHTRNDLTHLVNFLYEQQANGSSSLSWFGHNSPMGARIVSILHYCVTVGGYLGCVGYFFYQKKHGK